VSGKTDPVLKVNLQLLDIKIPLKQIDGWNQ